MTTEERASAGQSSATPGWLHLTFVLMTVVTGLVDAASYLGLGRVFTANMTGNVVLLGFAMARVPGLSIGRSSIAVTAALMGGVLAGRLKQSLAERGQRVWLTIAFSVETLMLMCSAVIAWCSVSAQSPTEPTVLTLIVLTAVAMGVRNGTVRSLGIPDITTTVLTLTIASLSAESSFAGGLNPRWGRRIAAIFAMLFGACSGALLLHRGIAWPLTVAALLNLVVPLLHYVFGNNAPEPPSVQPSVASLRRSGTV